MSDIQQRTVERSLCWWECDICGWRSFDYPDRSWPRYHKNKHIPLCARARKIGLKASFDRDNKLQKLTRISDGAELTIHHKVPRERRIGYTSLEEALADGWTANAFESGKAWKEIEKHYVKELYFHPYDDWHNPTEAYEAPEDWDWRTTEDIPWKVK